MPLVAAFAPAADVFVVSGAKAGAFGGCLAARGAGAPARIGLFLALPVRDLGLLAPLASFELDFLAVFGLLSAEVGDPLGF